MFVGVFISVCVSVQFEAAGMDLCVPFGLYHENNLHMTVM